MFLFYFSWVYSSFVERLDLYCSLRLLFHKDILHDLSTSQHNLSDVSMVPCNVVKYSKGFVKLETFTGILTLHDFFHNSIGIPCNFNSFRCDEFNLITKDSLDSFDQRGWYLAASCLRSHMKVPTYHLTDTCSKLNEVCVVLDALPHRYALKLFPLFQLLDAPIASFSCVYRVTHMGCFYHFPFDPGGSYIVLFMRLICVFSL